jgi:uncharacterized damage-inducible protein DinB
MNNMTKSLTGYRAWANKLTFNSLLSLPNEEIYKERATRFGNIVHTLNHVYVIDDIFKAHLLNKPHSYTARNTESSPLLEELWGKQKLIDQWYIEYAKSLSEKQLAELIEFNFVDGGKGEMTREEMILHSVNHATYHRGFVGDMMYQIPVTPPANDYTVFLREHNIKVIAS